MYPWHTGREEISSPRLSCFENTRLPLILDTAALIADCRTDICIENEENEVKMSKEDAVSTPNSERCGKKTMFPMVFAYEEAKSPRSPLGQLNLNTKFMVCNLI